MYTVQIATVKPAPDVDIHNINGLIHLVLYFLGGLPRRIGVLVQSTNGEIRLALPEQQHAQALDIRVQNVNGATYLTLPETYQGYLRLSTAHGNLSLGDSLERNSKLISGGGSKDLVYYVSPSSDSMAEGGEKDDLAELESVCHCHSIAGAIRVGYYGGSDDLVDGDVDPADFAWSSRTQGGCCILA